MYEDMPKPGPNRCLKLWDDLKIPVLIAAGRALPRNYAANCFPFRASSHFIHFVGTGIEGAYLAIDADGPTLFVPQSSAEEALWNGPNEPLEVFYDRLGIKARPLSDLRNWPGLKKAATVPALTSEMKAEQESLIGRNLGNDDDLALAKAIVRNRLVHDPFAKMDLSRAAKVTVEMHLAVANALAEGHVQIEQDAVRALDRVLADHPNMTHSFAPIATVRGDVLHNPFHHRPVEKNQLLLCDAGAEVETGYAGDVTRTWPVSGRFSTTQAEIYEAVLNAWKAAVALVRPGARYRDIHFAAIRALTNSLISIGILSGDPDELIADGVPGIFMPHGVGHLIGLDVHDMEDLGDIAGYAEGRTRMSKFGYSALRLDRDLLEGMEFSIEPGCYFNRLILEKASEICPIKNRIHFDVLQKFGDVCGIRIEDDVICTNCGAKVLTAALPRERLQVEALLQSSIL